MISILRKQVILKNIINDKIKVFFFNLSKNYIKYVFKYEGLVFFNKNEIFLVLCFNYIFI